MFEHAFELISVLHPLVRPQNPHVLELNIQNPSRQHALHHVRSIQAIHTVRPDNGRLLPLHGFAVEKEVAGTFRYVRLS